MHINIKNCWEQINTNYSIQCHGLYFFKDTGNVEGNKGKEEEDEEELRKEEEEMVHMLKYM